MKIETKDACMVKWSVYIEVYGNAMVAAEKNGNEIIVQSQENYSWDFGGGEVKRSVANIDDFEGIINGISEMQFDIEPSDEPDVYILDEDGDEEGSIKWVLSLAFPGDKISQYVVFDTGDNEESYFKTLNDLFKKHIPAFGIVEEFRNSL